jgi:hypothetical protein
MAKLKGGNVVKRILRALLAVFLLVVLVGTEGRPAQPGPRKGPPSPNEVEVRFADGSALRMTILQERFEIETRYGKLTVPTAEIRRIDFAFRLPPDLSQRIETAIKNLGDSSYEERQRATQELTTIGLPAYPALREAAQTSDAEAARRIRDLLQQIRAKVPENQLRFSPDDQVQTIKFTIAGRILAPTIQARSAYFSDGQVKITDLRSVRWLGGSGEAELAVDAARYGSAANQWLATDVQINAQDRLVIIAAGQVDLWPQQPGAYMTGPTGYQNPGKARAQLPGTLIGRIGESGTPFVIGDRYDGTPTDGGLLYLHIIPSAWNNASTGSYAVKVTSNP